MSEGFAVTLYSLERVANDHLPTIVTVYGRAIDSAQSGKAALDSIATVPEHFQGAGGSVSHAYTQLHGAVSDVLNSTKTSLDETADALIEAVTLYAENEEGVKAKLHEIEEDRGTPGPELTNRGNSNWGPKA